MCSKSDLNKDQFQTSFAEHSKYKMNLARIRRKKIPVVAGRSNALPPLDVIEEREKSAPVQGEGYSTMNERVKDANTIAASTAKANANKSLMNTNPAIKKTEIEIKDYKTQKSPSPKQSVTVSPAKAETKAPEPDQ